TRLPRRFLSGRDPLRPLGPRSDRRRRNGPRVRYRRRCGHPRECALFPLRDRERWRGARRRNATIRLMEPRPDDTSERIQGYLDRKGLSASNPRVVPLTPDASDRRYFRVLLPDAASIVLSLYSAPFDVAKLPFVNVATLMARMPVPIPEVLGHADDIGVLALQDLGDVTLQAHLGAATP